MSFFLDGDREDAGKWVILSLIFCDFDYDYWL